MRTFGFSDVPDADFRAEYLGGNLYGSSFILSEKASGQSIRINWSVPGKHQACNAAAAAAMASLFGLPLETIARGIQKTVLPGMRMKISEKAGVTWINDAYNANPDSMKASLNWLSEFADTKKLVLILGDMGEIGAEALQLHTEVLNQACLLFPHARILATGPVMCQAVKNSPMLSKASAAFPNPEQAADALKKILHSGDCVFLKASRAMHLERVEQEF